MGRRMEAHGDLVRAQPLKGGAETGPQPRLCQCSYQGGQG